MDEVGDYLDGGTEGERVVRALEVVPAEPEEEPGIEGIEIIEEQGFLVVDELFLQGAIKPLAMSVHLGRAWIRVPMSHLRGDEGLVEVLAELIPVIGESVMRGHGEHVLLDAPGELGTGAAEGFDSQGKAEATG
jgi:hypothetical protein